MTSKIRRFPLFIPPSEEVISVIGQGLRKEFSDVSVRWIDCPDLTVPPFRVASAGICGQTKLIQVGGVKNLLPLPNMKKIYDLREISEDINSEQSLFIGAGAGPFHEIGQNSELIANLKFYGPDRPSENFGYVSKTVKKADRDAESHVLLRHKSEALGILGDFFVCDGKAGQVIEVRAKHRNGSIDFITAIYDAVAFAWPKQSVGLGGVFAASTGRTKIHVMPDFSKTPLIGEGDVNRWLRFFEVDAPFVAYGSLVTNDPGYDIRPWHFHGCNRDTEEGGHFHISVDPKEAEYLGYFAFGQEFIRYDQPR